MAEVLNILVSCLALVGGVWKIINKLETNRKEIINLVETRHKIVNKSISRMYKAQTAVNKSLTSKVITLDKQVTNRAKICNKRHTA